jgi:hypothetical protein
MKIAIMMHGLAGSSNKYGTGDQFDVSISHKHFVENVLNVNPDCEIDIFMHSWSTSHEKTVVDLYNPKGCVFEDQIHFDFKYTVGNPNLPMNEGSTTNGVFFGMENIRFHSLFSRWYSASIVNELKNKYAEKNNINYDLIMLTRYDLAYLEPFIFKKIKKDKITTIPPVSNHGIHDLFFISNNNAMNRICEMFQELKKIKHFPGWNIHSHFLTARLVFSSFGPNCLGFLGSNRLWDAGLKGAKTGPCPLVRDHYDLFERNVEDPLELKTISKMREKTMNEKSRQYSTIIEKINKLD